MGTVVLGINAEEWISSRGLPVVQETQSFNIVAEGWNISSTGLPVVQETCFNVLENDEDILPGWTKSGYPLMQETQRG